MKSNAGLASNGDDYRPKTQNRRKRHRQASHASDESDVVIMLDTADSDVVDITPGQFKREMHARETKEERKRSGGSKRDSIADSAGHADTGGEQEDGVFITASFGKVATRDMPHPRPDCAVHPFMMGVCGGNGRHCAQCYCYVCDVKAAECRFWGSGEGMNDHANARPLAVWNRLRLAVRQGKAELAPPPPPPTTAAAMAAAVGGGGGGSGKKVKKASAKKRQRRDGVFEDAAPAAAQGLGRPLTTHAAEPLPQRQQKHQQPSPAPASTQPQRQATPAVPTAVHAQQRKQKQKQRAQTQPHPLSDRTLQQAQPKSGAPKQRQRPPLASPQKHLHQQLQQQQQVQQRHKKQHKSPKQQQQPQDRHPLQQQQAKSLPKYRSRPARMVVNPSWSSSSS